MTFSKKSRFKNQKKIRMIFRIGKSKTFIFLPLGSAPKKGTKNVFFLKIFLCKFHVLKYFSRSLRPNPDMMTEADGDNSIAKNALKNDKGKKSIWKRDEEK